MAKWLSFIGIALIFWALTGWLTMPLYQKIWFYELFFLGLLISFIIVVIAERVILRYKAKKFLSDPSYIQNFPMSIKNKKDLRFLIKIFGESYFGVASSVFCMIKHILPDEKLYFMRVTCKTKFGKIDETLEEEIGQIVVSDKRIVFYFYKDRKRNTFEYALNDIKSVRTHIRDNQVTGISFLTSEYRVEFEANYTGLISERMRDLLIHAIENSGNKVEQFADNPVCSNKQ